MFNMSCAGCGLAWYEADGRDQRYVGRCPRCAAGGYALEPEASSAPQTRRAPTMDQRRAAIRQKIADEQVRPAAEAYRPLTEAEIERMIDREIGDQDR